MVRIKEIREKKGLQQNYVAEQLQIPANTFNQYENCKREADYETLCKIADFYQVSVDCLLGRAIAKGLKINRVMRDITAAQIADSLKMSTENYLAYENGMEIPTLKSLIKIAKVLDCSISSLANDYDLISIYGIDKDKLYSAVLETEAVLPPMDIEYDLVAKIEHLTPEKKREAEQFVEFLKTREEFSQELSVSSDISKMKLQPE